MNGRLRRGQSYLYLNQTPARFNEVKEHTTKEATETRSEMKAQFNEIKAQFSDRDRYLVSPADFNPHGPTLSL